MNKVYISGMIVDRPVFIQSENASAHLVFQLCVRHRTAKGEVKHELYAINAWNKTAIWGRDTLQPGRQLTVQGYLTQRMQRDASGIAVEITAEEFFLGADMMQKRRYAPLITEQQEQSIEKEDTQALPEMAAS